MAKEAGVVKSLSGKAIAVDQNGNERELKVGDIVYMGESVKTSDAADKVTIVANNGKELTVLGSDTLSLNPNTIGAEGLADISALQNAILNGGDLTKLEETAAGGNAAAGGGDGVSLGEARFAEGGHYSNINENYRNLTDTNRAFASYDSPIGGYADGGTGAEPVIIPGAPTVTFISDADNDGTLGRVEHLADNSANTSKVLIEVPNDGTVRAGDILNVTVTDPNGVQTTTNIVITPNIIANGYPLDAQVEKNKTSKVEATITNFQGNESEKGEDSVKVIPEVINPPTVEFTNDGDGNHTLNRSEHANDPDPSKTKVVIKVPNDANPGDKLVIEVTNPDGSKTPLPPVVITPEIIRDGHPIEVPVERDKKTTVDAKIVDKHGDESTTGTNHVTPIEVPEAPTVKFTEDIAGDDGLLTYTENNNDTKQNVTPVLITVPSDAKVGDTLNITITKPGGTTETRAIPINQNIIDNGYTIPDVPVGSTDGTTNYINANGDVIPNVPNETPKTSKVEAFITDQHGQNSQTASDTTTPDTRPVLIFTEDLNNDTGLGESENKQDGNNRSTTVEITLPKDVAVGDKVVITYTDPVRIFDDPNAKLTKEVILDQDMVDNLKVKTNLPIFPDVNVKATAHVETPAGVQKSPESYEDKVWVVPRNVSIELIEQKSTIEITRNESMGEHKVNVTTARITLPNKIDDGDKLELTVNEHSKPQYKRIFTIHMDDKGMVTKVTEDTDGNKEFPVTATSFHTFTIDVPGFELRHGENTKIHAHVENHTRHARQWDAEANASLEHVKAPVVSFDEAKGSKSMSRANSLSDNDEYNTTVTIKIPKNAVDGDKIEVKITEPQLDGTTKDRTVKFDIHKNGSTFTVTDENGNNVPVSDNGFKISGVGTLTSAKTVVTATIIDTDGIQSATGENSVTVAGIDDAGIYFGEDADLNTSITRDESSKDGELRQTSLVIKVPNNVVTGDKMTLEVKSDGVTTTKEFTITKDTDPNTNIATITLTGANGETIVADASNKVTIPGIEIKEDKQADAKATFTDSKGFANNEVVNEATLEALHDDMSITFAEDGNFDGILNAGEAASDGDINSTKATIKLPSNVVDGDILKISVDGKPDVEFTIHKDANGVITTAPALNVAGNKAVEYKLDLTEDQLTTIKATVSDKTGVDKVGTVSDILLDAQGGGAGTALRVLIDEDKDRNGKLSRDEANSDGNINVTSATVTLPSSLNAGENFVITVNGTPTTYKVSTKTGSVLTIEDASGNSVTLQPGNVLKIPNIPISVGNPAKVEFTSANSGSKAAEAELEAIKGNEVKVSFDEDNASRDGGLSRNEAVSDLALKQTTMSVKIPYNVIDGDKVAVVATDTVTGNKIEKTYVISKDASGRIFATDENGVIAEAENNTIKVKNVPMSPGGTTEAKATLTSKDGEVAEDSGQLKLAKLSAAGLNVSYLSDTNDDGKIDRSEADSQTTKVAVTLPGSVITSDSLKVTIDNPDGTQDVKTYSIEKSITGVVTLTDTVTHAQTVLDGSTLVLDNVAIAAGTPSRVTAELSDQTGERVEVSDEAQISTNGIRGVWFREDENRDGNLTKYENSIDGNRGTTKLRVYLDDDAKEGDTVELTYTDPFNPGANVTKTAILTADDINRGEIKDGMTVDIDTSVPTHNVTATINLVTPGGVKGKATTTTLSIEHEAENDTVAFNANSERMYGGDGNDTLVFNNTAVVDFGSIADLNKKVDSFENIQLKGNSEIKFDAKDIFAITDDISTVLKISGDATSKVDINGKWHEDASVHADAGFKGYTSNDTVNNQTLHIQIEDKIQTDL